MRDGLFLVAVTRPDEVAGEAAMISSLLLSGEVDMVHIRKPDWDARKTEALIKAISPELWGKIKLHDNFQLLEKYPLAGVHLNSRCPEAPWGVRSVSKSLHQIEQLHDTEHYHYVTLSPIFDSISKTGYKSKFVLEEIAPLLQGRRVVALGGVTPEKFPALREAGFFGAAMLGHFWR